MTKNIHKTTKNIPETTKIINKMSKDVSEMTGFMYFLAREGERKPLTAGASPWFTPTRFSSP